MSETTEEEQTCAPLDSFAELMMFLRFPPPWTALCKELTPHSDYKIVNMDLSMGPEINIDTPETFCHFNPDTEDPSRVEGINLPKTLVCHDMANGYHDDSFIDGTAERNAYTFYNWGGIDIFCYFSHHLITIPPVGWINVGHAHGVKVIGTVITEWHEGVEFWDDILGSERMFQSFAKALVNTAKLLKFDGWLLNVENKISKPQLLIEFVQYLHTLLHEEIPHAELIWYDSVTSKGNLNWQNALNEKNRPFFDACDGIFTNYSWSEFDVSNSAIEAGRRITDVYIGIDVWGRNFYGGGKFNTHEALKVVSEVGCSVAVFAPAWTHEALSLEEGHADSVALAAGLDRGQLFLLRDRALWGSLWPFLCTRLPCRLPFKTSFCRGLGKKRRLYGEVIGRGPWFNLRHQQYQPNSAHGPHGYLLSSEAAVRAFARAGAYHDAGGILRYRDSFEEERAALHARADRPDPPAAAEPDDAAEPGGSERPPYARRTSLRQKPAKRTIKDCIKDLFGAKAPKKVSMMGSDSEQAGPARAEMPAPDEKSPEKELQEQDTIEQDLEERQRGGSMESASVHLRVGRRSAAGGARWSLAAVARERECLQLWQEDSFTGGACLRVHPADELSASHRLTRLLHCDFPVERALVAVVASKPPAERPAQCLDVWLHARAPSGRTTRVLLLGRPEEGARVARRGYLEVAPLEPEQARFRELQRHLLLHHTGFYVPHDNYFGWRVRYYEVRLAAHRVTSVNVQAREPGGPVLLGHFGLCPGPAPDSPDTPDTPARDH